MVRAAVFTGDSRVEVREFPNPEPPEGGAVLRVEAVGLCGSDVAQFEGIKNDPRAVFPVVPGHEIVGRIEQLGAHGAERLGVAEGDRVAVDEVVRCGRCPECRRLLTFGCREKHVYGMTMRADTGPGLGGGYGERMILLPGTLVYRLPEGPRAEDLTLFEPLANAVNWVQQAGVGLGDVVVVQGPGHQGLAVVQAAIAAGAGTVVVTGTSADTVRFEAAHAVGANHVVDVEEDDPVDFVADLTNGQMADVVFDVASGSPATIPLALDLVRLEGDVVLAGLKHFAVVEGLVTDQIPLRGLTIHGGMAYTMPSMRAAVELLRSGRLDPVPLRGEVLTLEDIDLAIRLLTRTEPGRDAVRVTLKHD